MHVRNLKKNPSLALRQAEDSPVLVLKGDKPNALIIHLEKSLIEGETSVRPALAASLFKDETLSLGLLCSVERHAHTSFLQHLGELGIAITGADETTEHETRDLGRWLAP